MLPITAILALLASTSSAHQVPKLPGFKAVWSDSFEGSAGSLPDTSKWSIEAWYKDLNGDYQEYKASKENLQLSGNGVLRIIPKRDSSTAKGWSSGRLESKYTFTPAPNAKTVIQGYLRLGKAPASKKQGIWPAFWLLGDTHRTGGPIWPACGEIDIMEHVNGDTQGHAAIHCDKAPGGICEEKKGIANSVDLPDAGTNWHTWKVVIDRTPSNWVEEGVTFYVDGKQFHELKGSRINDKQVWATIAQNKMFVLLNVAVGGDWPQPPNEATAEGLEAGMEVGYVAHYVQEGAGSGTDEQSDYENAGDPLPEAPAVPKKPAKPHTEDPSTNSPYPVEQAQTPHKNPAKNLPYPDEPDQPPEQDTYTETPDYTYHPKKRPLPDGSYKPHHGPRPKYRPQGNTDYDSAPRPGYDQDSYSKSPAFDNNLRGGQSYYPKYGRPRPNTPGRYEDYPVAEYGSTGEAGYADDGPTGPRQGLGHHSSHSLGLESHSSHREECPCKKNHHNRRSSEFPPPCKCICSGSHSSSDLPGCCG
ncbi:hypothetical protein IL306_007793 [Fusarium sp. DS 682]|nr:hypothetical protein IL306_007793 [Fusarium sp. DS 682]